VGVAVPRIAFVIVVPLLCLFIFTVFLSYVADAAMDKVPGSTVTTEKQARQQVFALKR
jgi:hypothetical protein